jgi:hypothetical protein
MLHWPSLLSLVIFLGCQPLDKVVNEGERLHKISILWRTHITINVATNHIRSLCAPEHVKNSSILTLTQEHFTIPRICGSLFKSISTDSSSSAGLEDFGTVCELGASIVSILARGSWCNAA